MTIFWAAGGPVPWRYLVTNGEPHQPPAPGCIAFIPLFDTEQQAREWAGPNGEITPLKITTELESAS
jgi:hypothetical protein